MQSEKSYLEYLRASLPKADQISFDDDQLLQFVNHEEAVRSIVPWGNSIPEDIFMAFVLFPRVNNEDLTFYHPIIWNELKNRLAGLSMEKAVLEVNCWCLEHAVYQSTDGRTANPLTIMKRTFGRCGEESVLLVSALRSCCIPARQVYVPRWSHCDDNHAWVEVWVDGTWHYLGACEPEIVLDSGWFTSAASKAMLVHTRSYGVEIADQRSESRTENSWELNCTPTYAKTRLLTIHVEQDCEPLPGINVEFQLANSAELFPINTQITDENGNVSLLAGLGCVFIHATDGNKYAEAMVQADKTDHVTIDFSSAVSFETDEKVISQYPPKETKIQRSIFPEDALSSHDKKIARCNRIRQNYESTFDNSSPYLASSRGNHAEIQKFLDCPDFPEDAKLLLLSTLREKDLVDSSFELLKDAISAAIPYRNIYPEDVWAESVLCPRVFIEKMYPVRNWLHQRFPHLSTGEEVWEMLKNDFRLCQMEPANLFPSMKNIVELGECSGIIRDVLFVNICRANGIAARLNPVSREKELWYDGSYHALSPLKNADSTLVIRNDSGKLRTYGEDFSVARLDNGIYRTLHLYGKNLETTLEIPVMAGKYRIVCVTRQMDGTVDALLLHTSVENGGISRFQARFLPERTADMVTSQVLPSLEAEVNGSKINLPLSGNSICAFIAPGQEPTEHFLNELLDAKASLAEQQIYTNLIISKPEDSNNQKLQLVLNTLSNARLFVNPDSEQLETWRRLMQAGELRLPLAIAIKDGTGRFAFTNYHVGSVQSLIKVLSIP